MKVPKDVVVTYLGCNSTTLPQIPVVGLVEEVVWLNRSVYNNKISQTIQATNYHPFRVVYHPFHIDPP